MLLGGLEDKYRTMYLKTMDAVREYMLYRPMVPDNRDILFSGKVTTAGHPDTDLTFYPEVTHLTCFLGGMVGMGAKLFGLDTDMEIAKKLSDGCVWAYESMRSGIMPEVGKVIACKSVTNCPWNETLWHEALDPMAVERGQIVKNYDSNKVKLAAQQEASRLSEESKLAAEEKYEAEAAEADGLEKPTFGIDSGDVGIDPKSPVSANSKGGDERAGSKSSLRKRDLQKEVLKAPTRNVSDDVASTKSKSPPSILDHEDRYQKKLKDTEDELVSTAPRRNVENPPKFSLAPTPTKTVDLNRPLTHEEYVMGRIELEGIPPGFVYIPSDKYILR
jgi:mannosyl-oligosaccharide alpha-1,2-mannosidase